MGFVVETGAGLSDATSYVSLADADAYHADCGNTVWAAAAAADKQTALIRATAFIDATYRGRFPGYPAMQRLQAREWPRVAAYVSIPDNGRSDAFFYGGQRDYSFVDGVYYIPSNQVPREIVAATCEGALRELSQPNGLAPDLERGGAISKLKAGSVEVTYSGGAVASTVFQAIDLALASLLIAASPYGGRVARG